MGSLDDIVTIEDADEMINKQAFLKFDPNTMASANT